MKATPGRGSMGPRLSGSLPCGQKLHERTEEAGPCPDRRWKTTHSSFSKSRRPPWLHRRVKAPQRSEREGASPRIRWCHLPVGRFTRTHLGWETPTCTWEDPEIYQMWVQSQASQSDWSNETEKKCPIKLMQTTTRVWLILWAGPVCLSTCTAFSS